MNYNNYLIAHIAANHGKVNCFSYNIGNKKTTVLNGLTFPRTTCLMYLFNYSLVSLTWEHLENSSKSSTIKKFGAQITRATWLVLEYGWLSRNLVLECSLLSDDQEESTKGQHQTWRHLKLCTHVRFEFSIWK